MGKTIFFKTLVDILYIFHFIGLLGILFIVPLGTVYVDQVNIPVEDWNLLYWAVFIVSLIGYIIFLRGLYFLRKMARFLLSNKIFSEITIQNLKKAGNHFLYTGIISFTLFITMWINKLIGGKFELIYNDNIFISLFLTIIGIFFIIQSNTLNIAKGLKEENDLTV